MGQRQFFQAQNFIRTMDIEDMVLVNSSRLSVKTITKAQCKTVCKMALMKIQQANKLL